jgi:hypothetical protein
LKNTPEGIENKSRGIEKTPEGIEKMSRGIEKTPEGIEKMSKRILHINKTYNNTYIPHL